MEETSVKRPRLDELREKYRLKKDNRQNGDGKNGLLGAVGGQVGPRVGDGDKEEEEEEEETQYALKNLCTVMDAVLLHYAVLFTREENGALALFRQLPTQAQTVWARLHPRKYRIFRRGTLKISGVRTQELEEAVNALSMAGFAQIVNLNSMQLAQQPERTASILRLFKVAELRSVAASNGILGHAKLTKDVLLQKLGDLVLKAPEVLSQGQTTISFARRNSTSGATDRSQPLEKSLRNLLQRQSSSSSSLSAGRGLKRSSSGSGGQRSILTLFGGRSSSDAVAGGTAPKPLALPLVDDDGDDDDGGQSAPREDGIIVLSHAVSALFDRLNFLFFLNQSDYHAISMANMGLVRYAAYRVNRHPIFSSRDQLLDYLNATHAVDYVCRLAGASEDMYSHATEVPIPGRSLSLNSGSASSPEQELRQLFKLAVIDLFDAGCIDLTRDPVGSLRKGVFRPLMQELQSLFDLKDGAPTTWAAHLETLTQRDANALRAFEPPFPLGASEDLEATAAGESEPLSQENQTYLRRFRREYAQIYLLRVAVDWLEKQRDYQMAITLLRCLLSLSDGVRPHIASKIGALWLRLSLDCAHLLQKQVALEVAQLALADHVELPLHSQIKMQQRVLSLSGNKKVKKNGGANTKRAKKRSEDNDDDDADNNANGDKADAGENGGIVIFPLLERLKAVERIQLQGSLLTRKAGRKSLFEGVDGDPVTVEEFVLQHFATHGNWSGMHCENSLWRSVVALLMWDVIWDDSVPCVFQTPYQAAPLDLYTCFFYPNRRDAIQQRIEALKSICIRDEIFRLYALHFGIASPVSWDEYSVDVLCSVAGLLDPQTLVRLLEYALKDFRGFSKGMPDLCLYNASKLFLCEVKGPRDRLSPEQEAHLLQLNEYIGIKAIVCHVGETRLKATDNDEDEDGHSDHGNNDEDDANDGDDDDDVDD